MSAEIPRWLMCDPARAVEHLQRMREKQRVKRKPSIEDIFMMTQDESEQVENLLDTWYRYESAYIPALGAPRVSPSCRGHDPGDIFDSGDERDAKLEKVTAEAVSACLDELHYLERASIQLHMRNKVKSVHRNPRLGDPEQAHTKYHQAKERLFPYLKKKGLIK